MLPTLLTHLNFVAASCSEPFFFGLKPWYHYLKVQQVASTVKGGASTCEIVNFNVLTAGSGGKPATSDIPLIALALVDDLLRIAGFVAVAFLIYGGILYVTSQGAPDQTQKAQATIQNALIGLVIAVISIAVVSFIGNKVG